MTRLIPFLVFACAVFLFAEPKLSVAVTLAPYAKIVQEIAGEKVSVVTLVPPNANPHTFEPKPNSLRAFSKATLYLSDGSGLDKAWRPRFQGVNPNIRIVDVSQGVSWMKGEPHEHAHHEHEVEHRAHEHHEELDPHIYLEFSAHGDRDRFEYMLCACRCRRFECGMVPIELRKIFQTPF